MVYLHDDREQFVEAINLTVYKSGLTEEVIEKDYYVTLLLKHLTEGLLEEKVAYETAIDSLKQIYKNRMFEE